MMTSASACSPTRASSSLYGSPATEKIGSFCDSTSELNTSIIGMPVWTIWSGHAAHDRVDRGRADLDHLADHVGPAVAGTAGAVEDAPEQVLGERHLHGPLEEPDAVAGGDALRAGEHLQADLLAFEADDLGQRFAVVRLDHRQFVVAHAGGVHRHHVAGDLRDFVVVLPHDASRPFRWR